MRGIESKAAGTRENNMAAIDAGGAKRKGDDFRPAPGDGAQVLLLQELQQMSGRGPISGNGGAELSPTREVKAATLSPLRRPEANHGSLRTHLEIFRLWNSL